MYVWKIGVGPRCLMRKSVKVSDHNGRNPFSQQEPWQWEYFLIYPKAIVLPWFGWLVHSVSKLMRQQEVSNLELYSLFNFYMKTTDKTWVAVRKKYISTCSLILQPRIGVVPQPLQNSLSTQVAWCVTPISRDWFTLMSYQKVSYRLSDKLKLESGI